MTPEEREQVVELLRCAADTEPGGGSLVGMFGAETALEVPVRVWAIGWQALDAAIGRPFLEAAVDVCPIDETYRAQLLEAAQRVEEGSWP